MEQWWKEPTILMALAAGIKDESYRTVWCELILRYSGEAVITMDNGRKWKAIGHGNGPRGGLPGGASKPGWIEFIPMDKPLSTRR